MKFHQFISERLFKPYSFHFEKKRKELFYRLIMPQPEDKVLDLGGNNGRRMAELFPGRRDNIFIADISEKALEKARNNYGYTTTLLDESGHIPFSDGFFDITFCNSVIEHVTTDKNEVYNIKTNKEFREKSLLRQKRFADEIRRVSKKYFVQTPNKHFIIESHAWIPSFYIYLPRRYQIKFIRFLNRFWFKKCTPDFNLLTVNDMIYLFPGASVIKEKSLFMTKSIMVYDGC